MVGTMLACYLSIFQLLLFINSFNCGQARQVPLCVVRMDQSSGPTLNFKLNGSEIRAQSNAHAHQPKAPAYLSFCLQFVFKKTEKPISSHQLSGIQILVIGNILHLLDLDRSF